MHKCKTKHKPIGNANIDWSNTLSNKAFWQRSESTHMIKQQNQSVYKYDSVVLAYNGGWQMI